MKSIFDGYLTSGCENCPFWNDGSKDNLFGYGCCIPCPIDACPYFSVECMGGGTKA